MVAIDDSNFFPALGCLPHELLQAIFIKYCDAQMLENIWRAISSDLRRRDAFWEVLNRVLDRRIKTRKIGLDECSHRSADENLCELATNCLKNFDPANRHLIFRQRLDIMKYAEQLSGVLWCGDVEFKDPMLPDCFAQTARVVLRCDGDNSEDGTRHWYWSHVWAWNRSFPPRTIVKLVSQMYNFIPVPPRGELFGVTPKDQAIIREVKQQLQSRDQVMTLRFGNTDGFILRVISPTQAQQRLAKLGMTSPLLADLKTSSGGLVCSWECNDDETGSLAKADKLKLIRDMVETMEATS